MACGLCMASSCTDPRSDLQLLCQCSKYSLDMFKINKGLFILISHMLFFFLRFTLLSLHLMIMSSICCTLHILHSNKNSGPGEDIQWRPLFHVILMPLVHNVLFLWEGESWMASQRGCGFEATVNEVCHKVWTAGDPRETDKPSQRAWGWPGHRTHCQQTAGIRSSCFNIYTSDQRTEYKPPEGLWRAVHGAWVHRFQPSHSSCARGNWHPCESYMWIVCIRP